MSESLGSIRALRRMRTNTGRNKPPFLTRKEIRQLAEKLDTTQYVVESVLQVAGHVLRERYRRRGWLAAKRGEGHSAPNTARSDVAAAMEPIG